MFLNIYGGSLYTTEKSIFIIFIKYLYIAHDSEP